MNLKKLLIATLFASFTLSAQAQDLPKECEDLLDYMKTEVEPRKDKLSQAETDAILIFQVVVQQNGEKAAACADLHKTLQKMKTAK